MSSCAARRIPANGNKFFSRSREKNFSQPREKSATHVAVRSPTDSCIWKQVFFSPEVERNISLDLGRKVQPKFTGHRGSKNLFSPENSLEKIWFRTSRNCGKLRKIVENCGKLREKYGEMQKNCSQLRNMA